MEQCTAPKAFDKYCETCEPSQACPALRRCSQLACEQASVDTATLWWEPAPFKYRSDQPTLENTTVRYAMRPVTLIRYDGRNPDVLDIEWHAADKATARRGREAARVKSFLLGGGARTAEGPRFAEVKVFYFDLIPGQGIVELVLHIDQHGVLTGAVRADSRLLADIIEAPGDEVAKVQWLEPCK